MQPLPLAVLGFSTVNEEAVLSLVQELCEIKKPQVMPGAFAIAKKRAPSLVCENASLF